MLTNEQRAARRDGIGGSDAGVILDVSPYKTRYELWCEKTQKLDPRELTGAVVKPQLAWGNRLEGVVIDAFQEETGLQIAERDIQTQHAEHPFILGSLDAMVADGNPLEVKTSRYADNWGDSGSADIPDWYFPQVQHYIGLYPKAEGAHVAALLSGSDLRIYFVPRDQQFITDLYALERDFWINNVQAGVPPGPTHLPGMLHRYSYDDGTAVEADSDLAMSVAELKDIKDRMNQLEAMADATKLRVMEHMGHSQILTYQGRAIVTWKSRMGQKRFDSKAFGAVHPQLLNEFTRRGEPSRQFLIK